VKDGRSSVSLVPACSSAKPLKEATVNDVTQLLDAIDDGDAQASEKLLPLVYEELRKLAAQRLAKEPVGQTLQATALVHDVFVRLVDAERQQKWNSRGHFFGAAAEAMRRILVENARHKRSLKRGGDLVRQELNEAEIASSGLKHDVLAVDEVLDRLAEVDEEAATLVKLRYFTGLSMAETAEALGVSTRSAERSWTWAKAWMFREISEAINDS
jgi:RNA polymerase sigma factor (TIGR02999 family)